MEPPRISVYIIFLETRLIGPHFAADTVGLTLLKSLKWSPQNFSISARVTFQPFKVIQGH